MWTWTHTTEQGVIQPPLLSLSLSLLQKFCLLLSPALVSEKQTSVAIFESGKLVNCQSWCLFLVSPSLGSLVTNERPVLKAWAWKPKSLCPEFPSSWFLSLRLTASGPQLTCQSWAAKTNVGKDSAIVIRQQIFISAWAWKDKITGNLLLQLPLIEWPAQVRNSPLTITLTYCFTVQDADNGRQTTKNTSNKPQEL